MGFWISRKTQKVKRGSLYVTVRPGEPIPEAQYWPNRDAWERMGFIQWLNRPMPTDLTPLEELPPREVYPRLQQAKMKTSEKQALSKEQANRGKEEIPMVPDVEIIEPEPEPEAGEVKVSRGRGRPRKNGYVQ